MTDFSLKEKIMKILLMTLISKPKRNLLVQEILIKRILLEI